MNFEPILYGPLFIRDAQDINLVAASADPVDLTVSVGGSSWTIPVTPVLTNNRYLAALRMREILSSVVGIPGLANAGEREVPLVTLSAGDATMSVRAVYGAASGKTPTQLAGHWLSWRDQVSMTHAWGRERLTFLAGLDLLGWQSGTYSVKAKVFLSSGDPVTVTLTSGTLQSGCRYVTVDASYATIAAAVSASVRSKIRAWDVSYSFSGTDSQSAAATINGYPLRLIIARDEVRVKEFVFCNSFGVEDRVYSSGRSNPKLDGSSVAFLSGATEYELRNDSTEGREVYSGRLGSARESALWLDFLKAHDRYILASGGLARIIVDSQETDLQDNALGSVKFTYHLGALDNGRYFNDQEGLGDYDPTQRHGALYIGDEPPSEELPSEDLFFLKTRLDEFPVADLSEEYLFLVQDPLTLEWCNAPLSDIKEWLQQVIIHEDVHVWSGPWEQYSAAFAGYALAASLGKDLLDRVVELEKAPAYQLPIATDTRLGGIKVGSGLSITQDGVLSADDVCYFEQDPDYSGEAHLKSAYTGLRIPGLRFGEGREALDLEVITVNGQRCLHSPLPILSDKDIAGFYDGGSGGGTSDFDEAAMWAALGGTIGTNEVIDISHIPNLPTTKIYDLETWISGKGFLTQIPVASSSRLGGVKIGAGISIASDGTISAASSEELALAVAMNASRLDDLEAAFDAPVFGELYAETLRSRSASATELWIGAVRLWYQDGSVRVSGGVLADGDVSGFYDGGSGGGSGDFDEAEMWIALGTTINVKKISSAYLPDITFPVTSVAGATGAVSTAQIANALTAAGYKLTDTVVTSLPWSAITGRPTKVSELTNDVGYITASALTDYATTAYADAAQGRLARAIASNAARLNTLEDWLTEPAFSSLFADTLHARSTHTDEVRIGPLRLWYEDGAIRTDGHIFADGDVSGFYTGGTPGGGGGSFDESAMWQALGTDITTQVIDASHLPTSPVTSVVGLTGAISQADLRTALGLGSFAYISSLAFSGLSSHPTTLAGYGITDVAFGAPGADYVPVTLGGTTKNVLTAHQSLAGYLTTTSAAATYETIANVDAIEQRLALALGTNEARIAALEEWAEAPAVGELYVENLRARMAATDEIRIGGVTITADMIDGKPYLMIAGGVTATLDVSGFYDGGSGGSGSSSFDEAAMWTALGGTIGTNEKVSTAHLPMSDLDTWVAGKGYVTSSGVTSISMTVPTGFSVSGVPITSTGTLALAFSSGYSLPTNAKQGDWDSAYANSHTHSNKSVLDGISSSKVNNWDAGYLLATTAASTYETISNVDTVEKRLAAALGVAIARLNTLDDWTADVVPELQRYTDTVLGDVRQPLEVALACCTSRLDALENAFADGQFADLNVATLGVDYLATRGNAWIGGSLCAAGDVGGFYGSDRALKDDIRDFSATTAADILRRIRLVSFTWNARASRLNADNVGEDFGVIAQEVEAACPRMVRHGHYGEDLLGVDYAKRLPSVLLGGWHDHERRIAALERENKQLKEKLRQNGCI